MSSPDHHRALEQKYLDSPINQIYQPTIEISEGTATLEIPLSEKYHHAAGGVHGSVYFKMLDDAAFFAANSLVEDVLVLTTSFTTYLTRPISAGRMRSEGRVVSRGRSQLLAEAVVLDGDDREIGRGSGVFVPSRHVLSTLPSYERAPTSG